jgi:hypothetical protein
MNFKNWIKQTHELIDLIREVPYDFVKSTRVYNSQFFGFQYDAGTEAVTYKLSKHGMEYPVPVSYGIGNIQGPVSYGIGNIQGPASPGNSTIHFTGGGTLSVPANSGNWNVPSPQPENKLYQVSITVLRDRILDLKFISKSPDSSIMIYSTSIGSSYRTEDGGNLVLSTLFVSKDKVIVCGKLYDIANSPEAFNEDLMNEEVSILEPNNVQEYFYGE